MFGKKRMIIFSVVLVLLLNVFLVGCGSQKEEENSSLPDKQEQKNVNEDKKQDDKKVIIRLGHLVSPNTPMDLSCKKFKELAEERSNGKLEVQIFDSAQLGNETEMVDGLEMGSMEMVAAGDGPLSTFTPGYAALSMPFTFRDQEHFDKVVFGPIGEEINQAMIDAKNVRVLSWWSNGPRYLIGKKPMPTPEELKGVKMRVPEMPVYTETWKSIGALATPIYWNELYSSLQQGVIDAAEAPIADVYQASFHEITKFIMKTKHVYYGNMILISEKFYNELSADLQDAILTSVEDAKLYSKQLIDEEESQYQAKLEEAGVTFVDVDRQAYMDLVEGLPLELEKQLKWKPGLWQQIYDTK